MKLLQKLRRTRSEVCLNPEEDSESKSYRVRKNRLAPPPPAIAARHSITPSISSSSGYTSASDALSPTSPASSLSSNRYSVPNFSFDGSSLASATATTYLDVSMPKPIPKNAKLSKSTSQLDLVGVMKTKVPPARIEQDEKLKWQKKLSISSPVMSPSHARNKKFHSIFTTVAEDERVVDYFSCAYVGDYLMQGHLYITDNHFGFYSGVFGMSKKILIEVSNITEIERVKLAKIIPNAVKVSEIAGKKYTFGSLIKRETAFKLMVKVWKRYSNPEKFFVVQKVDSEGDNTSPELDLRIEYDSPSPGDASRSSSDGASASGEEPGTNALPSVDLVEEPDFQDSVGSPLMTSPPSDDKIHFVDKVKGLYVFKTCIEIIEMVFPIQKVQTRLKSSVVTIQSLPRTTLFLAVCTILLVFMYMSAVFLIYRLNTLNYRHGIRPAASSDEQSFHNYRDAYWWHNHMHAASVSQLRESLAAQIQQLVEVRKSLETLKLLASTTDAFQKSETPGSVR